MVACPNRSRKSPEDFAFWPTCGRPLTPPGREIPKTETVVSCDVTGSTAMGERLDPETEDANPSPDPCAPGRFEEAEPSAEEAIRIAARGDNFIEELS